jgi:hypothetical protein
VQTDVAGPINDIRKRKYEEDLMKSGITSVVINGDERPQCIICCEVLENESFNVNKLMRLLKAKLGSCRSGPNATGGIQQKFKNNLVLNNTFI